MDLQLYWHLHRRAQRDLLARREAGQPYDSHPVHRGGNAPILAQLAAFFALLCEEDRDHVVKVGQAALAALERLPWDPDYEEHPFPLRRFEETVFAEDDDPLILEAAWLPGVATAEVRYPEHRPADQPAKPRRRRPKRDQ